MIILTATWANWTLEGKTVRPTPGRDRPLVVECKTPHTAAIMRGVLARLGFDVEAEDSDERPV